MATIACGLLILMTVYGCPCAPIKPKNSANDINAFTNVSEENDSLMNSVENSKKHVAWIDNTDCYDNWNSFDCPDFTIMDEIIFSNMKSSKYDLSEFTGFDIKLSPEERHLDGKIRKKRASINYNQWPKSKDGMVYIPYIASQRLSASVKENLTAAIADYNRFTCIRLINRTTEKDYLHIDDLNGCWSFIGKRGSAQSLSLGAGCYSKGTAIHEIMHALGFFHEQSRRDRDRYITIDWKNIPDNWHSQFDILDYGVGFVYGEGYDYNSVMHYGSKAAAIDSTKNTITAISDPYKLLGQRVGFTHQDLREINLKYECGRKYVQYE